MLTFDPLLTAALPVFIFFILLEMWLVYARRDVPYPRKDALASVGMGIGSVPVTLGVKVVAFLVYSWLYKHRFHTFDMSSGWSWAALMLADDFSFYWHHRTSHEVRLFWAGHVNHHSSEQYNFAVALRQSWGELTHKYFWWLWMPLVGFPPLAIFTGMAVSLIFQFFLHTEGVGRLGVLEYVLNTPSHHRVHHGANLRYLDRNYGGILSVWDRLFGSFEREGEKAVYGLTHNIHSNNLLVIAFHEYRALFADVRRAPDLRSKLGYLFRPPGWRHDGPVETTRDLQSRLPQV